MEIDAELCHRRFPSSVEIGAKHQRIIGANGKPTVALYLLVELAGTPAGVTKSQQASLRTVTFGDRFQYVDCRSERHFFVNHERRIVDVIGRVQYEAPPTLDRPAEVDLLVGDASLAADRLGWRPTVDFVNLVEMMVDADMALLEGRLRNLS